MFLLTNLNTMFELFMAEEPLPNTMFSGVLLWALIEVLVRNVRSLYALWRQKTPLTNGKVKEAKAHYRKMGEPWLKLGWKPTPWVHLIVAHCGGLKKL